MEVQKDARQRYGTQQALFARHARMVTTSGI
jgi:hypothetical protein